MNRAWIIRAEQRLERLEKRDQEQRAVIDALKSRLEALDAATTVDVAADAPAEPVKRGPGRPRKEAASVEV